MGYTRPPNGECSSMFMDSFMGGGGAHIDCHCGIWHVAIDSEYLYEDNPPPESERVKHHHDVDAVTYFDLDGKIFCRECVGCRKFVLKYEDFFWNNRQDFRRYLKTRVDQEKAWADQEHLLNILSDIK